jgi:hypothetical protein
MRFYILFIICISLLSGCSSKKPEKSIQCNKKCISLKDSLKNDRKGHSYALLKYNQCINKCPDLNSK